MHRSPFTGTPWIHSPRFADELAERSPTDEQAAIATQLHDDGYAVIPAVADDDLIEQMIGEVVPLYDDQVAVEQRRVQDAWNRGCESVRTLATAPRVIELLQFLFDRRPIPFQTLTFKWGTEQRGHADSIHFSCLPRGFMCGVWVALEDTDAGNGPLFYYPGSHRQPEYTMYDLGQTVDDVNYDRYADFQEALMAARGVEPVEFHAKRGDALLWSSNIVHGGRPVTDAGRTRWSQVTHYYFEESVYYTPVFSDFVSGEWQLKGITDLTTVEHVPHRYNGLPVEVLQLENGRSRLACGRDASFGVQPAADDGTALRARIEELEHEVRDREQQIEDIVTSETYKIGRRIVQPIARARAARRR
jgi:ectoine hydroxylase-related dioxygenase (phytanoyl-CoA dioxygenase family)